MQFKRTLRILRKEKCELGVLPTLVWNECLRLQKMAAEAMLHMAVMNRGEEEEVADWNKISCLGHL